MKGVGCEPFLDLNSAEVINPKLVKPVEFKADEVKPMEEAKPTEEIKTKRPRSEEFERKR